jgi:hypothetical protein
MELICFLYSLGLFLVIHAEKKPDLPARFVLEALLLPAVSLPYIGC